MVYRHYEYILTTGGGLHSGEGAVPDRFAGIVMIEQCVSEIVGSDVEFLLIQTCRFFSPVRAGDGLLIFLDISLSRTKYGEYLVKADISDEKEMLMELNGIMSVSVRNEEPSLVASGHIC